MSVILDCQFAWGWNTFIFSNQTLSPLLNLNFKQIHDSPDNWAVFLVLFKWQGQEGKWGAFCDPQQGQGRTSKTVCTGDDPGHFMGQPKRHGYNPNFSHTLWDTRSNYSSVLWKYNTNKNMTVGHLVSYRIPTYTLNFYAIIWWFWH